MRKIYQYKTGDGRLPVEEFINTLESKAARKILSIIEMLKSGQCELKPPYVKSFSIEKYKGFWEIRTKMVKLIRIIFCLSDGGDLILLCAFLKRQDRSTERALETAKQRFKDIKSGQSMLAEFRMTGGAR